MPTARPRRLLRIVDLGTALAAHQDASSSSIGARPPRGSAGSSAARTSARTAVSARAHRPRAPSSAAPSAAASASSAARAHRRASARRPSRASPRRARLGELLAQLHDLHQERRRRPGAPSSSPTVDARAAASSVLGARGIGSRSVRYASLSVDGRAPAPCARSRGRRLREPVRVQLPRAARGSAARARPGRASNARRRARRRRTGRLATVPQRSSRDSCSQRARGLELDALAAAAARPSRSGSRT